MSKITEGTSYETAIILKCKYGSLIIRERQWITEKYGDWDFRLQKVCFKEDKTFDIFTIVIPDESQIDIFFDITKPYNKKYKMMG